MPTHSLLDHAIRAVSNLLAASLDGRDGDKAERDWEAFTEALMLARAEERDDPLARLPSLLRLDDFALKTFLIASSVCLDSSVAAAVAKASGGKGLTVGLLGETFFGQTAQSGHLLYPLHLLVRRRLTTLIPADAWVDTQLRVPRPLLAYLLGSASLAPGLERCARIERPTTDLLDVIAPPPSLDALRRLVGCHEGFREAARRWSVAPGAESPGLMLLVSGPPGCGKTRLAEGLANHADRTLITIDAGLLPTRPRDMADSLTDLLDEADYRQALVVVDHCERLLGTEDRRGTEALRLLTGATAPVLLLTRSPGALHAAVEQRVSFHCTLQRPNREERRQIWEVHLPPELPLSRDVDLDVLASTYDFDGATIAEAVRLAVARAVSGRRPAKRLSAAILDEAARAQLRQVTDELTVRSQVRLRLADIVLPPEVEVAVADVLAACRNQSRVLSQWGFGERLSTGTGITVLFDGPPGTGKTYCAEILASELGRPLFRVNLPEVVSKWVGETEKNLQALFRQARVSQAVLLFDEADALFSRRVADTRSASDRSANMEVNLLLQEMERYPGVCFLTTNHFDGFDGAVVRRIAHRVTFARPGVAQRERIWETLMPSRAPLADDVDFGFLAEDFELSGGEIKNALLRAAYWAADRDAPIAQADLERACRREYVATGKLVREVA